MRNLDRLSKLEAHFKPLSVNDLPPSLVEFSGFNGGTLEVCAINQLSNSWPLTIVREWLREEGESMDEFTVRVIERSPRGALLIGLRV